FDIYPGDGVTQWNTGPNNYNWKDWSTVGIDLSGLTGITAGQSLDVVFTVHGCAFSAHTGYAYISAVCSQMSISSSGCSGSNQTLLSAPPGFATYVWRGPICPTCPIPPPIVGSSQTCTIINANMGDQYRLDLTSLNGCMVQQIMTTMSVVAITPSFIPTANCVNNPCSLFDNSTISQNQIVSHHWDFGDGTQTTTTVNPVAHTYALTGSYTVILNPISNEGCTATATQTFNVGLPPYLTSPLTRKSICSGDDVNIVIPLPPMATGTWSTTVVTGNVLINTNPSNFDGLAIHDLIINNGTNAATIVYTISPHIQACFGPPATITITVNPRPVPLISGPSTLCVNAMGGFGTEPGMTNYIWACSPGGTITTGSGTSSINVNWNNTGMQSISVNYTNFDGCLALTSTVKSVNVGYAPTPSITGPYSTCLNTNSTFLTETGMASYFWTVSPGGTIVSGFNTAQIQVLWSTTGEKVITVNYTTQDGCIPALPASHTITVNPSPIPSISGSTIVCNGNTATYSTTGGMSNYQWNISSGGTITSGGMTNLIMVHWTSSGQHEVDLTYSNAFGCTNSPPTILPVFVIPS
ncbi:MAG: PKD domain-containing protein, partial [Phycisphaerae bacterium]